MNMNLKPALRYSLRGYGKAAAIFLIVIYAVVAFFLGMSFFTGDGGELTVNGFGMAAAVFAFVVGVAGVRENFRLMLQFGISRKTAFVNELISGAATLLATAVLGELLMWLGQLLGALHGNVYFADLFQLIYISEQEGVMLTLGQHLSEIVFNTTLLLALLTLGQMFSLIFWRLNKVWTVVVAVSIPLVLNGVPACLYNLSPRFPGLIGAIQAAFNWLLISPWNAIVFFVVLAVFFALMNWLLVRRTNIKAAGGK